MIGLLSIIFGISMFYIVVSILYSYGENLEKINNRLIGIAEFKSEMVVDEELSKPISERLIYPVINSIIKRIVRIFPQNSISEIKQENLRKQLRQAGMTMMPQEYSAIRLIIIITTALLFLLIGFIANVEKLNIIGFPIIGAYGAFTVMRFKLMSKITKRRAHMESQLPDVLDMISVNVEAGLAFEQAISHVINHFEGPLIDELTITYREMSMGRNRKDALNLLGERCDIDDIKSFAGAVVQAGRMGISLKNVLHTQAAAIRDNRRSKIEEKAQKMSVKMLLPMVIFIFPVIFIILMGPAVVSIIEMFGAM